MILAETLLGVVEDPRNYLGGRDGARVFLVPRPEMPGQQCNGVIKLFPESGFAPKEFYFEKRMCEIGNHAPEMLGVGQYTSFPRGHPLHTPAGRLEGVLMKEISGFRFEELPKTQRSAARDAFAWGVVNAIRNNLVPGDSYWNGNVIYREEEGRVTAWFFDFSRWQQKRIPMGKGMAFLRKACDLKELPAEVYS